jgi:hypothetical protein
MARAALGWSAAELGAAAGTSAKSVMRFEAEGSGSDKMTSLLASTLEAAGIRFTAHGRSIGVFLQVSGNERDE